MEMSQSLHHSTDNPKGIILEGHTRNSQHTRTPYSAEEVKSGQLVQQRITGREGLMTIARQRTYYYMFHFTLEEKDMIISLLPKDYFFLKVIFLVSYDWIMINVSKSCERDFE